MIESETHSNYRYDTRHAVDRRADSYAQKKPGENAQSRRDADSCSCRGNGTEHVKLML